jgi:hypothetical protein
MVICRLNFLQIDYLVDFALRHERSIEEKKKHRQQIPNPMPTKSIPLFFPHPNGAFVLTNSPLPDFKRHGQTISIPQQDLLLFAPSPSPSPPEIKIPL